MFMHITRLYSSSPLYNMLLCSWISHYLIGWHLSWPHFFAIKNSAVMTISAHISLEGAFFRSGLPCHGSWRKWHCLHVLLGNEQSTCDGFRNRKLLPWWKRSASCALEAYYSHQVEKLYCEVGAAGHWVCETSALLCVLSYSPVSFCKYQYFHYTWPNWLYHENTCKVGCFSLLKIPIFAVAQHSIIWFQSNAEDSNHKWALKRQEGTGMMIPCLQPNALSF